jgi:hypothetical protein
MKYVQKSISPLSLRGSFLFHPDVIPLVIRGCMAIPPSKPIRRASIQSILNTRRLNRRPHRRIHLIRRPVLPSSLPRQRRLRARIRARRVVPRLVRPHRYSRDHIPRERRQACDRWCRRRRRGRHGIRVRVQVQVAEPVPAVVWTDLWTNFVLGFVHLVHVGMRRQVVVC